MVVKKKKKVKSKVIKSHSKAKTLLKPKRRKVKKKVFYPKKENLVKIKKTYKSQKGETKDLQRRRTLLSFN